MTPVIQHIRLSETISIGLIEYLSSKLPQTPSSPGDLWEKILSGSEVLIRLYLEDDVVTGLIAVLEDIPG